MEVVTELQNIDLVLFDCDGVLVDSEPIANRVFAQEVRKLGIPFTDEEAQREFPGTTLAKCISYVEQRFDVQLPSTIEQAYRVESFKAFQKEMQPVEGIEPILRGLQIPFCVASNGPLNKIKFNLDLVGFTGLFNGNLYSAYDIDRYKPDPALFLHAANRMQTAPERCLVIEDSIHGFEAAQSAKMKWIAYDPHDKHPGIDTHQKVSSMKKLLKAMQSVGLVH